MYFQNQKLTTKYSNLLNKAEIPNLRGHKLSEKDKIRKELILNIMTKWKVSVPPELLVDIKNYLSEMKKDELVIWKDNLLEITDKGKPFLRIIATAFDEKFRDSKPDGMFFSKAI
jgi:coproporphyrinogen III oxidase/oxygen-independent coproporphyrinogen-3 oxidase